MDATQVKSAVGAETYSAIQTSDLPKIETMTLLQIWEAGNRAKLKRLAQSGDLLAMLKGPYREALELANKTRGDNSHLTVTECLQVADLPLKL